MSGHCSFVLAKTYLCNAATRVRLGEALAQRRAVALEPRALLSRHLQVPQDTRPDALPRADIARRLLTQQADEVKVADDARPQRREHLVLEVVVVLVQRLFRAVFRVAGPRRRGNGGGKRGGVVVNGDAVDVVHGADEVVDAGRGGGQLRDERAKLGADKLGLEADEDVNLGGVGGL